MLNLRRFAENKEPKILCLGAHADDIEIGCGGTILRLTKEIPRAQFYWMVFSGDQKRAREAVQGGNSFLEGISSKTIKVQDHKESYFPYVGASIKESFEAIKREFSPDLVFTHYQKDAHQDHRLLSDLTWNTFRDHLILEYEIPKYDGDLATPNLYVLLDENLVQKKTKLIFDTFQSQKDKHWFAEETFRSILRIRGVECNSPSRYAEGFYCRKMVF
jgi:LmbE family N-acetylglucosaminyl deacetylase